MSNGSFSHIINSLKGLLDYMDEDARIGFVFYSDLVSFLRIDPEDLEISLLRCYDKENPICPLSF
jgi:hypothetical protein